MKQLFKVALLAMALAFPFDEALACDSCGPTQVWVDAYRDSHGHYHQGYWKVVQLCHPPVPVVRPRVIIRTPTIRIGHAHHVRSTHYRTSRGHSVRHGSRHSSQRRR